MRIAIYNHIERYGGAEVHIERLRDWLMGRGIETRLFLPENYGLDRGRALKPWEHGNLRVISSVAEDDFDLTLVFAYRPFGAWLPYLRRLNGQVVFSVVDYWISCPRLTRVCEECSSHSCRSKKHRIFKKTFPIWNGLFWFEFHSQHVLDRTVEDGFFPRRRIVLRHGVDVDRFRPMNLERNYDLLYLGRMEREKGIETLTGVLPEIIRENPEFKAAFAGRGRLEYMAKNLKNKFPDNIDHMGFVDDKDIPVLYNKSKLFVHYPAWEEPFGLTPLEAMACGTEVLTADLGGLKEFIPEDSRVTPGSPESLREAILARLSSPVNSSKLRTYVVEKFSEEVIFPMYVEFYRSIIE